MMFNRRAFLFSGIGAGMALSAPPVLARPPRAFFKRIGRPIGLQLYTLGEEAARDPSATLAAVADIGYRDIELPNLYGSSAAELRRAADQAGLRISSLHLSAAKRVAAPGLSLSSSPAEIADTLGALGANRGVLPMVAVPESLRAALGGDFRAGLVQAFAVAGADPWKRTAALLNERAAGLKPHGFSLGYHNHNLEFAPVDGTTGWDILIAECDPALVSFEVDIGWVATAGLDPAAFLGKLKGRVAQLHVKDVAPGGTANFALSMQPAEVGAGKLDWARILPAAHEAGARHFYVEQEPPFAIPRMEAVRRSFAFLSGLRA